jgi:hypothetical protein
MPPRRRDRPCLWFALCRSLPEGEWISLLPGQHLSGGQNLVPVVRAMAAAALALAGLPGVAAVAWGPARTVLSPEYFRRCVGAWLAVGPFPRWALPLCCATKVGPWLARD